MSEYHDYKERYLTMVREVERGINILIKAQRKCEELYLNSANPNIKLLNLEKEQQEETEQ